MFEVVMALFVGFSIGWLARSMRQDRRLTQASERWQATVDRLQGQLALERLRQQHEHSLEEAATSAETADVLDLGSPRHLARPQARSSDSTAARA